MFIVVIPSQLLGGRSGDLDLVSPGLVEIFAKEIPLKFLGDRCGDCFVHCLEKTFSADTFCSEVHVKYARCLLSPRWHAREHKTCT